MTILSVTDEQVVLHFVGDDNVVVVGNNSVSNVTSEAGEVVYNGKIAQVWHGSQGGAWIVERGTSSSNVVVGVYSGTGHVPYYQAGEILDLSANGESLYVTHTGSTNGYIMIDVRKDSSF